MRILFVNAYFAPELYEGRRVHIEQLASNLIALGHEVWVHHDSPARHSRRLACARVERMRQLLAMDAFYVRVEGHYPLSLPRYLQHTWWSLGFRTVLVWEINAASDLVAFSNRDQAVAIRTMLDEELSKKARRVKLALCNTDGLAQYARDLGIRHVQTVPLASDPTVFDPQVPSKPDIARSNGLLNIVWSGNPTVGWHDLEIIARAAERLRDHSSIRFYIIGEKPEHIRFPGNVVLLGPKTYVEMPGYLSAMDVGLATYKDSSWSRYGVFSSPLKLFDYLASGLVVVGSPIEQIMKCIQDGLTGFIVPFGDDEFLANRLRYIVENRAHLAEIRVRARAMVVHYYNWRRVACETVAAIGQVLGR